MLDSRDNASVILVQHFISLFLLSLKKKTLLDEFPICTPPSKTNNEKCVWRAGWHRTA